MEDPRWLRLITIGLILAALAVGYFLLSGRLISNSSVKTAPQTTVAPSAGAGVTPSASSPKPTPTSAFDRVANRTQSQVQTLPKTGFTEVLAGIFSVGIMISGWNLRKFPK